MEKDKKLVSFIMAMTGILLFMLVAGIVIFSLPDTTGTQVDATVDKGTESVPDGEKTQNLVETSGEAEKPEETSAMETQEISSEDTTQAKVPTYIQIVAVGDNLIHKGIADYAMQPDGSYQFDSLYAPVAPAIREADIAILNQEVPVGGTQLGISNYPNFNAPSEIVDAVWNAGFNVLSMATNHVLDVGYDGVANSLNYIHTNFPGILTTGAYLTQEERDTIPVKEVEGVCFSFLNYTYGLNGHSSSRCFINMIDEEQMRADIAKAKEQSDYIVVCMHWGEENQLTPTAEQKRLAQFLADCGVNLVIGTHPHVVQPMEILTGAGGTQTVVYYSLGNFISLQHKTETMLGGMAKITLEADEDGVRLAGTDYSFVVTQWNWEHAGARVCPWESYSRELAADHGMPQFDATFSYDALAAIVEQMRP